MKTGALVAGAAATGAAIAGPYGAVLGAASAGLARFFSFI